MGLLDGSDPGAHRTYEADPGIPLFTLLTPSRVWVSPEGLGRRNRADGISGKSRGSKLHLPLGDDNGCSRPEKEGNRQLVVQKTPNGPSLFGPRPMSLSFVLRESRGLAKAKR